MRIVDKFGNIKYLTSASGLIVSGNIGSGQVGKFHISSGAITSGRLGVGGTPTGANFFRSDFTWATAAGGAGVTSGSVQGYFGTERDIQSGTVGAYDLGSGAVVAGAIGSGAVVSGNIASGQIGINQLASGLVSGAWIPASSSGVFFPAGSSGVWSGTTIPASASGVFFPASASGIWSGTTGDMPASASGVFFPANASGIWSGTTFPASASGIWSGTTIPASASGVFFPANASGIWSGTTIPASASGVFFPASASGIWSGTTGDMPASASGVFFPANASGIWSGTTGVVSGKVFSGAVTGQAGGGFYSIASGTIGTFDIGSGAIKSGHIASGSIGQFHLSSGAVSSGQVGNAAVTSGSIASGQIGTYHISSGTTVTQALYTVPLVSGGSIIAAENISGFRAVALTSSGNQIQIAMASVATRMPAIGIVVDNVASGIQANVYSIGQFQIASVLVDYSGYIGKSLYVGRSGQIVTSSGSFNSGGLLSGDYIQTMGVTANSGSIVTNLSTPYIESLISSGDVNSGLYLAGPSITQTFITIEPISGGLAVALTISGQAWLAASSASGRMPAIGYTVAGASSGTACAVITHGVATPSSGLNNTRPGRPVIVNASGFVGNLSGGFLSGGFGGVSDLSGSLFQCIGHAIHSGAIFVRPDYICQSGAPTIPFYAL